MSVPDSSFPTTSCDRLIGLTDAELTGRFGQPVTRRFAGGDLWLVFRSSDLVLRVRCSGEAPARAASWTAIFAAGHESLREAAQAVGLWPAAAPDQAADSAGAPLIRRPLPCPGPEGVHSLTATVRHGRITQISVFDEPPDWL
jgi:hypothetical protein